MRQNQDSVRLAANLRELAAAGSTVDCSVAGGTEENTEVEIYQVGGIHDSMVFELPHGRTGYILDLGFINQTSKPIYFLPETELWMSWEDSWFSWLPDPKETGQTTSYIVRKNGRRERIDVASESYCFPGGAQLEYPRELVLNHILLKGCSLQPGCPLTGLLLATGGPMPHDVRHGQWLQPTLVLTASDHREYTRQIRLWTDRMEVDEERGTRRSSLHQDPLGSEVGFPVVLGNQHDVSRTEKLRSLDTDRDGRISV
jgi:hypothetical protein